MPRRLNALAACLAALGAVAAMPARALDVSQYGLFRCEVGDCVNGGGTARETVRGIAYQGPWNGGKSIPGQVYQVTHPAAAGRVFKATFGPDGLQDGGDMVFGGVARNAVAFFSGSYAHVEHPIAKQAIAVMKRGKLDTGLGFVYQGRFEFLPAKASMAGILYGTYIFFGAVIDTEDNSKETGLYLTDAQALGSVPRFQKANAAFLARLQERYREEMASPKPAGESAARLGEGLALVDRIAAGVAKPGVSAAVESVAGEAAMNVMTSMIKTDDKASAHDATGRAIDQAAVGDDDARRQLRGLLQP